MRWRSRKSDMAGCWKLFHAVLHAAANEIDVGRLERADASRIITSTMLPTLGYMPSPERAG